MPWRWRSKLRREGQRRSATTVADRPTAAVQACGMIAVKPTLVGDANTYRDSAGATPAISEILLARHPHLKTLFRGDQMIMTILL